MNKLVFASAIGLGLLSVPAAAQNASQKPAQTPPAQKPVQSVQAQPVQKPPAQAPARTSVPAKPTASDQLRTAAQSPGHAAAVMDGGRVSNALTVKGSTTTVTQQQAMRCALDNDRDGAGQKAVTRISRCRASFAPCWEKAGVWDCASTGDVHA
jgi:hypothetical protein